MAALVPVTFAPSGATAWVEPGATVLDAAHVARVAMAASCGGRGVCGECGVRVVVGALSDMTGEERAILKGSFANVRLACRARVPGAVTVKPVVPAATISAVFSAAEGQKVVAGIDLGTTSVSAVLIDPASRREVGRSTVPNQQSSWGADVLSRVSASVSGETLALSRAGEDSVVAAVEAATGGVAVDIESMVIAANSAMAVLLVGADAGSLAAHPFTVPPEARAVSAKSAVRNVTVPGARIDMVPPIAGFVGGDVLAGIVSTGMFSQKCACLLVDIGTNAEVALVHGGQLIVASAAAGPAFEGGGVTCGGPATDDAVVRVRIDGQGLVELGTIGQHPARWFSGAGLVSALAALRWVGHVDRQGLLTEAGPLTGRISRDGDGVLGIELGDGEHCLRLTQLDVRALQLAKAAVRVAIVSVLRAAGVKARDLEVLYVAGAFGGALDPADLVNLGLVPKQSSERVRYVGNTSLAGAAAMALDEGLVIEAARLAAAATHVDLAADPGFNAALMRSLALEPFSA